MTTYKVAFDIGGPENLFGQWGLLVIPAILIILVAFGLFPRDRTGSFSKVYGWGVVLFVSAISVMIVARTFVQGERLRQQEAAGNAIISEGCLTAFHPAAHDVGDSEGFQIGADGFSYSESDEIAGFHHTQSHGGPVSRDGRLRVTSIHGEIIRLETQDHACAPAPDRPTHDNDHPTELYRP